MRRLVPLWLLLGAVLAAGEAPAGDAGIVLGPGGRFVATDVHEGRPLGVAFGPGFVTPPFHTGLGVGPFFHARPFLHGPFVHGPFAGGPFGVPFAAPFVFGDDDAVLFGGGGFGWRPGYGGRPFVYRVATPSWERGGPPVPATPPPPGGFDAYVGRVNPAVRVEVRVEPPEAEVWFGGRRLEPRADRSYQTSLRVGSYDLEVRAPGYEPHRETVRLEPGGHTRVDVELRPSR